MPHSVLLQVLEICVYIVHTESDDIERHSALPKYWKVVYVYIQRQKERAEV